MKIKHPNITHKEFIRHYLNFYNLLVPEEQVLSNSEISFIQELLSLDEEKFKYQRISTLAKKYVVKSYAEQNIKTNVLNLNVKVQSLVRKKFFRRDEDRVLYFPKHILEASKKFKETSKFQVTIDYEAISN